MFFLRACPGHQSRPTMTPLPPRRFRQPGVSWWATHRPPRPDQEATAQARQRLRLISPRPAWRPRRGDLGSSSPLEAMENCSPIISSTRSSWPPCPGAFPAGSGPTCLIRPSAGSGCPSLPSSPVTEHPAGPPRHPAPQRIAFRSPGPSDIPLSRSQARLSSIPRPRIGSASPAAGLASFTQREHEATPSMPASTCITPIICSAED